MHPTLAALFNSIYPLPATFWTELNQSLSQKSLPKRTRLLSEGEVCKEIHFIVKGLARAWYHNDGEQVTSWFMPEGSLIISVESFFKQTRSLENIELLEDSELITLSSELLAGFYKKYLEFNVVGRVLTEHYYTLSEERLYSLRMRSSHERYLILQQRHPEVFNRAPLKHIASYLGMRPETLSRIRAER